MLLNIKHKKIYGSDLVGVFALEYYLTRCPQIKKRFEKFKAMLREP